MSWEDKYDAMCDYNAELRGEGEDTGKAEVLDEIIADLSKWIENDMNAGIATNLYFINLRDKYQTWRYEL